jgi:Sodium/hydrogen exchanger family
MKGDSPRFRAAYAYKALVGPCLLVLAMPALVSAAGADAHPRFGPILFSLAVLVMSAKVGGLLAERWHQPPVLGELLAGIALPNVLPLVVEADRLAFLRGDPTLRLLAEGGVLILLFDVGLEADLRALARVGTSSVLVALIGVMVPMGLGWSAALWFPNPDRQGGLPGGIVERRVVERRPNRRWQPCGGDFRRAFDAVC